MQKIITFEQIFEKSEQLEWEKKAYQEALNDDLDIETYYYRNLYIYGNQEQKAFYAEKWQETFYKFCGR